MMRLDEFADGTEEAISELHGLQTAYTVALNTHALNPHDNGAWNHLIHARAQFTAKHERLDDVVARLQAALGQLDSIPTTTKGVSQFTDAPVSAPTRGPGASAELPPVRQHAQPPSVSENTALRLGTIAPSLTGPVTIYNERLPEGWESGRLLRGVLLEGIYWNAAEQRWTRGNEPQPGELVSVWVAMP